jgi:hypothetical protein
VCVVPQVQMLLGLDAARVAEMVHELDDSSQEL